MPPHVSFHHTQGERRLLIQWTAKVLQLRSRSKPYQAAKSSTSWKREWETESERKREFFISKGKPNTYGEGNRVAELGQTLSPAMETVELLTSKREGILRRCWFDQLTAPMLQSNKEASPCRIFQ